MIRTLDHLVQRPGAGQPTHHNRRQSSTPGPESDDGTICYIPRTDYEHLEAPQARCEDCEMRRTQASHGHMPEEHSTDESTTSEDDGKAIRLHAGSLMLTEAFLEDEGGGEEEDGKFGASDQEGDSATGRISPCTFRLWAEGCTRWDGAKLLQGTPVSEILWEEDARPPLFLSLMACTTP